MTPHDAPRTASPPICSGGCAAPSRPRRNHFRRNVRSTIVNIAAHPEGREVQAFLAHRQTAVLAPYVPQQMSEAEIETFAQTEKQKGANLGVSMKTLKERHPGQYDGTLASKVVKRVVAA